MSARAFHCSSMDPLWVLNRVIPCSRAQQNAGVAGREQGYVVKFPSYCSLIRKEGKQVQNNSWYLKSNGISYSL